MDNELTGMIWAVAIGLPFMVACSIPIVHEFIRQLLEERRRPGRHVCQCSARHRLEAPSMAPVGSGYYSRAA